MKRILGIVIVIVLLSLGQNREAHAHCEIPCGIYGDSLRIELIAEHITTIEKSMNQIIELSKAKEINYNQLVRWVNNKEVHAEKIQEIVSQYFLHQRIKIKDASDKAAYANYTKQLTMLHELQVFAMKAKQTTDLGTIEKLRSSLKRFADSYFHKHDHSH